MFTTELRNVNWFTNICANSGIEPQDIIGQVNLNQNQGSKYILSLAFPVGLVKRCVLQRVVGYFAAHIGNTGNNYWPFQLVNEAGCWFLDISAL